MIKSIRESHPLIKILLYQLRRSGYFKFQITKIIKERSFLFNLLIVAAAKKESQ
jgi:hypothetical protein